MKRMVMLGCAVVAASAVATAGAATAGPAGGTVIGAGSVEEGFSVAVGAHGDADHGYGALVERDAGGTYVATVDCVLVYGNAALVVGTLQKPQGAWTKLVAEFVDNGHGRIGAPDAVISGFATGDGDNCHPTLVDFSDAFPVTHGNFVVRAG